MPDDMVLVPPSLPEGVRRGMNSRDGGKTLAEEVGLLLQNGWPGHPSQPRHGMKDKHTSVVQLGYGTNDSLFRPHGIHYKIGGKDFFLAWAHSNAAATEYHLEVWNATDDARTRILQVVMPNSEEYFGWTHVYDAIYAVLEHEISTNRTTSQITKNVIVEYIGSAWVIRDLMIDISPGVSLFLPEAVDVPAPMKRRRGRCVQFEGMLYYIGGEDSASVYWSDVWTSSNGRDWSQLRGNVLATGLVDFGLLVYDGKLWIIGGYSGSARFKSVYYSSDGVTWVTATSTAAFDQLGKMGALVYDSKMWVLGGENNAGSPVNGVFYSTDGITWTAGTVLPAASEVAQSCAVYDNKLVVVREGTGTVYYSSGGAWSTASNTPGWTSRAGSVCLTFGGRMYLIAGDESATRQDDVWYTADVSDNDNWTEAVDPAGFAARAEMTGIVWGGEMLIMGGADGSTWTEDAYSSADGETWLLYFPGIEGGYYVMYAATWVRRTDSNSVFDDSEYDFPPWITYGGATVPAVDEKKLTGTVDLAGADSAGNLTGTATQFLAELGTGALTGVFIRIDGTGFLYAVTNVASNTTATVSNASLHTYSTKPFARTPDTGDPATTNIFNSGVAEGIEDSGERTTVLIPATLDSGRVVIEVPPETDAVAKGATHLRLFRTEAAETQSVVVGLPLRYLVDIGVGAAGITNIGRVYVDQTSDARISGETNLLEVTGKEPPPMCRHLYWDSTSGRLWAYGDPDNEGIAYYSATPSDTSNPQKYASWFDLDGYFKNLDNNDGQDATGIRSLAGDLFFFKERSIWVLDNSNTNNVPRRISATVGCAFPQTLVEADIIRYEGESRYLTHCILFISEAGPAILSPGGHVGLFTEFAIDELWGPEGEIHAQSDGTATDTHTRNKVTAAFWQNTYWVFYGDSEDSSDNIGANHCFGFHFGNDGSSVGPLQFTFPAYTTGGYSVDPCYEPLMLLPLDGVVAYTLAHKVDESDAERYRLTRFLDPTVYKDTHDATY